MVYTFQWGNSRQYDRRGGEKAFKKRLKQLLNLPKNTLWAVKRVPGKAAECAKGSKQALLCQKPVDPEPPAGFMNKVTYKLSTYGSFAVLVCFFMTVGYMTVPIEFIKQTNEPLERYWGRFWEQSCWRWRSFCASAACANAPCRSCPLRRR